MLTLIINPLFEHIAVVPIVVNTGAALLPAIVAGLATAVSLIFKPKELIKLFMKKPWIPALMAVVIAGLWFGFQAFSKPAPKGRSRTAQSGSTASPSNITIDWTEVALEIIRTGQHASFTTQPAEQTAPTTQQTHSDTPFIFRTNTQRTGYDGGTVPENLILNWKYYPTWIDDDGTVIEDTDAMILSSPAVVGNWVYGASCLLDPPYNYGTIFCLDKTSGKPRWSFDTMDDDDIVGFYSSPAISADGNYLLIGQGLHPDENCNLICLNTNNGKIHWTHTVELHIESSPAIEGDIVVVGAGAIEDPSTKKPISHPGFVFAVRISDGEELWRYDVADPESSPVLENGIVYIGSGFNGKAIYALRSESDETLKANNQERLLWKVDTAYPITCAITVTEDLVIAGGGNGDLVYRDPNPAGIVYAINKADGSIKWQVDMPDAILGAITAINDMILCPAANGEMLALNQSDGTILWRQRVSGYAGIMAGAAATQDALFALSKDGYLAKLSLKDGSILEKHYVNDISRPGAQGLSVGAPTISGGFLFVGSETGGLRAYRGSVQTATE